MRDKDSTVIDTVGVGMCWVRRVRQEDEIGQKKAPRKPEESRILCLDGE